MIGNNSSRKIMLKDRDGRSTAFFTEIFRMPRSHPTHKTNNLLFIMAFLQRGWAEIEYGVGIRAAEGGSSVGEEKG
jgi:hypothetical protein